MVRFACAVLSGLLCLLQGVVLWRYSKFHVVDARTFAYEQVVTAAPERDISGLCFTPNGSKIYSCIGDNLLAYDVDQTSRRSFPDGKII